MKRYWIVAGAAVVGAVALFVVQRDQGSPPSPDVAVKWYHESGVALLSTTGRPQLVEFFHPT